jgi:hypothetical protein
MPMPIGIGFIDLMLGIPTDAPSDCYDDMKPIVCNAESGNQFKTPAQSMFKNVPTFESGADLVRLTVAERDAYDIDRAMTGANSGPQAVGTGCHVEVPVPSEVPVTVIWR